MQGRVDTLSERKQADASKDVRPTLRRTSLLEAEREAANVRLRAERRAGELLKELARADESRGGDLKSASARATPIRSPYSETLASTGTSRQQAHRFQALADMRKPDKIRRDFGRQIAQSSRATQ